MSGACSGKVELLCPLGNGEPANHRAQASFSFGGTSSMSTSDQYLIGVTSDGKRLAVAPSRSGTISSSQAGADMQICECDACREEEWWLTHCQKGASSGLKGRARAQ